MVARGTTGPRDKDVQTLQENQVHQTKTQGVEQRSLWKHKQEEKNYQGWNEEAPGTLHRLAIHRGSEKKKEIQMNQEWEARCP